MKTPDLPQNEAARLQALRDLHLLDTNAEERFDRLTRLAQQLFQTPIALVSLVDAERQWFKSRQGLDVCETDRNFSFCAHAILGDEIFYVPDATQDARFTDYPQVTGPPHIRFYAGYPLTTGNGHRIGTLCILDTKPRQLTEAELGSLRDLGKCVENEINQAATLRTAQVFHDQQAYLRSLFDTVRDGIISTDAHGLIQTVNPATCSLFGYRADELIGQNIKLLMPDSDAEHHDEFMHRYLQTGRRKILGKVREVLGKRSDGNTFPLEIDVRELTLKQNEKHFVSVMRDISERNQTQARLRQEQLRLAGIIEGTNVGTWEWNIQTGETVFNERWAAIVGYTLEELAPVSIQTWIEMAHPQDLKKSGDLLEKHFNGELPYYDLECRMRHKDGHWIWVHDRGRVTSWDKDGKPLTMSGTHSDITERKLASEALLASEQKLSSLYRMSPVAIVLNRLSDGSFLEGNAELFRMTGYSEQEFKQLSYWDITPKEYVEQEEWQLESLRSRGTYGPYEKEYIHKDGHRFPVLLNGTLISGDDGEPLIWSIVQDISERVRNERELAERERYTRAIIDNVVDAIITINISGNIESFNNAAQETFGYEEEEVIGRNISMLMPEPHRSAHDGYLKRYLETKQSHLIKNRREFEGLRRNGEHFPIELAVTEITYGGATKFVGVVRDITESKRVERIKNEFVSTVSHELRTPLTSIKGALSLILTKSANELPAKTLKMIMTANRNSERLQLLINDILDLDKIESGKMQFEFREVDLVAIACNSVITNESYAQQHAVVLRFESSLTHAPIIADEHRLQQVLANLISNAIKFSPKNSDVMVRVERKGAAYRVSVKDSGRGIPPEFHDRIFQRFAQADSSATREKGGTGLGLSITKAIIDRHDGVIDFSSRPGHGSEFFFELPDTIGSLAQTDIEMERYSG